MEQHISSYEVRNHQIARQRIIHVLFRTKRRTWKQMLSATLRKNPQFFKILDDDDPKNPVWYKLAHPKLLPNQSFNESMFFSGDVLEV